MTDPLVDMWMEIAHYPRGRTGQGQPEWEPVIRAVTARGLPRSFPSRPFPSREAALDVARQGAAHFGIRLRTAAIIPFGGEGAA